jgi:hypothetical protein
MNDLLVYVLLSINIVDIERADEAGARICPLRHFELCH